MRSEYITTELARAIEESRISVVILSKNYPSSSWCLNELQRIMKCKVSLGQIVMAIFYDVDPSDVREQTGDFGKVFEETCYGKTDEQKKKWRKALSHVAVIAGEHSISWASEAEMISKIVMDVSNELPSTDFDQLVGIEAHVAKLKAMVCLESDEVKVVGIWGPAGIGKATIARALYNQVSRNFQLKFYREPSWKRASNTMEFQEELLSGVLDHRDMKIPNKQEAIFRLMHQRVLVVIDCVSFVELQALQKLVQQWYLRFGSKVIVTNADLYTFTNNGIEQIYKVTYPSSEEALQIFSYAAFGQSTPPRGSALRGKSKEEWTMAPAKVNTCLVDTDIQKAIRFAHDESMHISKNLSNTIYTLSRSDWDVEKGIQTLADMALISISEGGEIMMHDLVQSMSTSLRWTRDMKIPNVQEAQYRLMHQRVLLVLDNVSTVELHSLRNLFQDLKFGSKVIVANENIGTFTYNRIEQIYKVAYPSSEEALQIFSYSAFGQSSPPRGYVKHAAEVSKLIAPFPLGLKVLGSALRGKSKEEWTVAPDKLITYVDDRDVEKAIRFAVDGLSEKQKSLFYSLSSSPLRGKKSLKDAIYLLAGRDDWDVEKGIQTLADMALISISSEGEITMHHLVDLMSTRWSLDLGPIKNQYYVLVVHHFKYLPIDGYKKRCPLSHPTHPHLLSPLANQNPKSICFVCGKQKHYTDPGFHYHCTICHHENIFDGSNIITDEIGSGDAILNPIFSTLDPVDIKYGQYSCKDEDCSYILHSKCATHVMVWDGKELEWEPEEVVTEDIAPFKNVGDGLIEHFGHEHHLKLEKYDSIRDAKKQCQACVLPIYKCYEKDCKIHWFKIDVTCCLVPEYSTQKFHEDPIFIAPYNYDHEIYPCNGCKRRLTKTRLQCTLCEFSICYECATIPEELHYKHDEHPLTLCYGEDTDGKYWCEECEKQVNPSEWFYTCNKCCITIHRTCLFGFYVYLKPGHTLKYNRATTVEVLGNSISTRPICSRCEERCRGFTYFKVDLKTLCSWCPLTSLTYMDLSASKNIKDIPNLSGAMNMEKLYLRFCENLVTVSSSSLQNLNKLKVLDMSCCTKLKALPTNINLESLSILNLRGCSKLKRFPCISTQVQFMSLGETAIEKVPSLIRLCSRLVSLEMAGCKNLKTLPPVPASIEILDLSKTRVEASEAQMISKIVKDVSNELPSTDFDRLVGVEAHVAKLKSMIRLDSDEVKMAGIWGPAGIGKTTIAKALYNQVSSNFQLKFYKEIFKGKYEVHNLERYDLQNRLKKELLSGILDHRDMNIPDLGEAEERLKHQRVLLILDDVFLHDLKGLRDVIHGLRYGSKVIVTSEDIDTLRECGIHQNQTYRVAFPSSEEALQIISYSAFGQRFPPRSYLEHADEVAKLVSPFPLGLRVIGSSLRGKSKDEWITALAKLKTCHGDKDVETAIRFAYEGLSDKQKTLLYLLTDSISSGENVNNAIFSLSQSDWDAEKGIQTLADIAFISISGEGRILMHYLKAKVLIFLLLLFVESMAGTDTTGSSRHEKRKEARLQKNQKKHESWLQRQKLQKEKRVSASSSVQTKTDDVIKSETYKEAQHVKSVSPGGNKVDKKSFTQKKSEHRVKPKEKKMQRGHKTKDLNKPRKKTKFEEYLEMETQSASLSREQDAELERKLAKKLKVKNGKLRGVDDGMNDLFEGLPSVLDSMESELGDSRKKKGKRKRSEEKQDYEEDFELGESDFSDEDSDEEPKRKRDRKHRKKKKSLDEEVETHPMEITDDGESETVEYDEKVESPLQKPNPESSVKYVAPHLRSQARSESEEQAKLRTRVKGLLNKMAESNVESITAELSTLYRSVARSVSSQIFCEEVLATYARGNEQYGVFAAFIAGMACQVGMDFSAQLIASLAKSFEDEYQKEDSLSLNGITLLLSYLCLLGVCSSDLIYDFLMTLANRLTEVDACTILIVLDSCGMKIRSDDPVAMKTFIVSIQNKTNEIKTSPDCKTDINKFTMEKMLETIAAIKNNKLRAKEDSVQNTRVKKWLQKLRVEEVLLRGLTWSKLLDTEKKGQWWLSGDLVVKTNHAEDVAQTMDAEVVEAQKMLKLADAQRMNTDSRKAIFCVIMSSEDYIDAFEKLLRLDLPGKQDREIMRVLVECCLQEKVFNKYYTYCIWDHFKELETMSLQRSMHLAKFVAEMIVSFNLSLAVLKCVDLANPVQLTPKRIMHFRMLFEAIFEHTEKLVWNLFTRIAVNPDYEALRDGIKFFMKEYVVKANKTIYGKFRKAKEALNNSDGSLLIKGKSKAPTHKS
ncbi:hypothetical protein HID58_004594 [Brassica napus]|uniref:TIR domain-containing protein n=1 Tax=Brassica napus TaxID=3708 RepID=A0ABQ8E8I1_BRANA|nr:hypothetical protein HID58_004594 [Brassica napus]